MIGLSGYILRGACGREAVRAKSRDKISPSHPRST